jgi:thiol:disulfide interchange protein DsbD
VTELPGGAGFVAAVFLMGLGLNLTPCVYPMLSVTVSLFGGRREHAHVRPFFRAVVYVLGIATMYSALGTAAAWTGEMFGAALQQKWVLGVIAALLVALALSMFGLYTFQLPRPLIEKLSARHAGLLGIYLSGVLVGVFAAPCIGPPIVALLAFVGTRGDPWFAFVTFFVMSLGLGLPYLVLGTFSGLLAKLPRSGVWLVWVDHVFGTLLLGLAAFYVLLIVEPAWIRWLPTAVLTLGGVGLGFLDPAGGASRRFAWLKRAAGAAAVAAGLVLALAGPKTEVAWEAFSVEKLEAARAAGKPVVVDFYADWCIPCHELDRITYADPRVVRAMEPFARLKADLTEADAPPAAAAVERFGIVGVPTVLFIDSGGREVEDLRVTGFIPPEEMLEILASPRLAPAGADAGR